MIWNDDAEETTGISREEKYGRTYITYVDIVRCKDCKHYDGDENSRLGTCLKNCVCSTPDWYCADGELKGVVNE